MEKSNAFIAVGIVILAVAVIVMAFRQPNIELGGINIPGFSTGSQNGISVTGESEIKVNPDTAELYFAVETKGVNAKEAQELNARTMNAVIAKLKSLDFASNDLQTQGYNLYIDREWNKDLEKYIDIGYKATHTLKARTTEFAIVGEAIQKAVEAGANRVDSVQFVLSDDAEKESNQKALADAAENARMKAEGLAKGLGVKVGKVLSISTQFSYRPIYYGRYALAEAAAEPEPPKIQPREVPVSATVNVVFAIE